MTPRGIYPVPDRQSACDHRTGRTDPACPESRFAVRVGDIRVARIRVDTLVPCPIETSGLTGLVPAEPKHELLDASAAEVPVKRLGHPDKIASAVLFLASDQSSFITGAELAVINGRI
ncbi:SDR family oxidoreductase [Mycobacterium sp. E802]|uniref:SDR family oxidoreductase n=1 Tax=Mycobacterium sp. E802 TaxID=1834152 RepID=UPI001E42F607|nr:SDR family oxidoreductase [Mycobacterium sp. E802]